MSTPVHNYPAPGVYRATLTVTDDGGLTNTTFHDVVVELDPQNQPPVARFTFVIDSVNPLAVDFDGSTSYDPDGTVIRYAWEFGDGTAVVLGGIQRHLFSQPGSYDVTLTVTDNASPALTGQTTQTVVLLPTALIPPTADFTYTTDGFDAEFDGTTSFDQDGSVVSYAWNFGDTRTSNGSEASHTYATAGTYPVRLLVTDDDGLTDSLTRDVVIIADNISPVADFTFVPTNLSVAFRDTSTDVDGTIVRRDWDFGDSSPNVNGANPTHVYQGGGLYRVTLTVTDNDGATNSITKAVPAVAVNIAPFAAFIYITTPGFGAIFDASGSSDPDGSIVSYRWSFGDGQMGIGLGTNHTFSAAGDYDVTLTVIDNRGASNTNTQTVTALDWVKLPPVASWTYLVRELEVTFDGSGSRDPDGTVDEYLWDFGDGDTSTEMQPVHTYLTVDTFPVSLTVTDNDGLTNTLTIDVTTQPPGNVLPVAAFSYVVAGAGAHFDGSSSFDPDGTITSHTWDFGDGGTATGPTANHVYATVGVKTVRLTVTDNDGGIGTSVRPVEIIEINTWPTAAFTYTEDGLVVDFDGSGSNDPDGSITAWHWYYGDDSAMGNGETVQHVYGAAGSYDVTLAVHDDKRGWGVSTQTLTVAPNNQPPLASFTWTATELVVAFDASASIDPDGSIASYAWRFNDNGGGTATGVRPNHTFSAAGDYDVELTVRDNNGAPGVTNRIVHVTETNVGPTARFVMDPVVDTTVTFDASTSTDSDGTLVTYGWAFGDGTTGTGITATHTYTHAPGVVPLAILTVTDDDGDTDSLTRAVNFGPTARFNAFVASLTVLLDGSPSSDRDGSITQYAWTLDGAPESGERLVVQLPAGAHQVELTVTDNSGLTSSTTQTVTTVDPPPNQQPTASFTWVADSLTVDFDARASTDPEGPVAGFNWDYGDGENGTGSNPVHNYDASGTYPVTLVVTDLQGLDSDPVTQDVEVLERPKIPPLASFGVTVLGGYVYCDARPSIDDDGFITDYAWDFHPGTGTGNGPQVAHQFLSTGFKTIDLIVTDNDGLTDRQQRTVEIVSLNVPPIVFDYTWVANNLVVDFTCNAGDPDSAIETYYWNFGDGADLTVPVTSATTRHTYPGNGTYTARVQVEDSTGLFSNTVSHDVTVDDGRTHNPPVSRFTYSQNGPLLTVNGSTSTDDGTIEDYAWDFGEAGATGSGITATHTYPTVGYKTVTLRVTDDDGLIHSSSQQVYITGLTLMPEIKELYWDRPTEGQLVHFHIDHEANGANVVSTSWSFYDGSAWTNIPGTDADYTYWQTPGSTMRVQAQLQSSPPVASTSTIRQITVPDFVGSPPVPRHTITQVPGSGEVMFDGSTSTDADGTVVSWDWNFGDSVPGGGTASGENVTHAYPRNGQFDCSLTVTDNIGNKASEYFRINVTSVPSYITNISGTDQGNMSRGSFVATVNGSSGDYLGWDFGDGTAQQNIPGTTANHDYPGPGKYTVTARVYANGAWGPSFSYNFEIFWNIK